MIALCEKCFPDGENYEVHTIVPLTPCEVCGQRDTRYNRGLRVNLFPRDPRNRMRLDYTCGCGLYVHPENPNTNPKAIHIDDCPYKLPK